MTVRIGDGPDDGKRVRLGLQRLRKAHRRSLRTAEVVCRADGRDAHVVGIVFPPNLAFDRASIDTLNGVRPLGQGGLIQIPCACGKTHQVSSHSLIDACRMAPSKGSGFPRVVEVGPLDLDP